MTNDLQFCNKPEEKAASYHLQFTKCYSCDSNKLIIYILIAA